METSIKTIFEQQQRLKRDPIEILSSALRLNGSLSGDDVLYALEHATGRPLPEELQARIRSLVDPTAARRGRPPATAEKRAITDFVMEELDRAYASLLAHFQRDKTYTGDQPASERAYRRLAEGYVQGLGLLFEWRSLQNTHSAWRNERLNAPDDPVDSDDFDAEIARQFPRT
ncbi:hypothetical protein IVB45_09660 [Bradyrhizobium sp. 4]|uniref:hypothetical protein n=1 Tax=unclassified Bradyrhizobium TaxID=2631580 RepID=UPI001FFA01A3|nr:MULTISPECIES: hypothetical protein [unclassified Bradyrhizobium]MCK1397085.1 hypothetical protein [Bradyrhizobium sp. 39]MCK1752877.1 hypothetical protein [Bradyrhizobium sp. 135]UPJ37074.1 hypothetical protein IVB45_09660 [Bradyrhizobium sp. 4]